MHIFTIESKQNITKFLNDRNLRTEPLFIEPLRIIGNISRINVDWSKSFEVNSDVVTYQLIDNYDVIYTGFDTSYSIRRTSSIS